MADSDFVFDCEQCKYKSLFAVEGTCFNNTFCLCPDGYTGVDDFLIHQDCHVNISLARWLEGILLVAKVLGFCSCLLGSVFLYLKWGISPFNQLKNSKDQNAFEERNRRTIALRRNTLRVSVFLCFFTGSCVVYNAIFLFGVPQQDRERVTLRDYFPFVNLVAVVALSGVIAALFLMLRTWYDTLPDIRAYGRFLGVAPFFVKYPDLIPRVCTFSVYSAFLISFVIVVCLPLVSNGYLLLGYTVCSFSLLCVGVFSILQYAVISNVIKMYKDILKGRQDFSASRDTLQRTLMFEQALNAAYLMRRTCTLLIILCALVCIAWLSIKVSHQYLFIFMGNIGPGLLAIIFPPLSILYTNGGLSPYQRTNSATLPNILKRSKRKLTSGSSLASENFRSPELSLA